MFRRIYRQRRRIGFAGFFATLALLIQMPDMVWRHPVFDQSVILSALVFAAIFLTFLVVMSLLVGLLVVFLTFLMPSFRREIETFAIVMFVAPLAIRALPDRWTEVEPFLPLLTFLASAFLVIAVFNGFIFDSKRLRIRGGKVHSFVSPKSPEEVWAEIVPGAGPCDGHWQPNLVATFPVPNNPDDPNKPEELEMHFALGDGMYLHRRIRFLRKEAPYHVTYEAAGEVSIKNRDVNTHRLELQITPDPKGGCTVSWTENTEVLRPRDALLGWFDDITGDTVDHLRAKHSGARDWSLVGHMQSRTLSRA